jgi:hypothetical protein
MPLRSAIVAVEAHIARIAVALARRACSGLVGKVQYRA